MIILTVYHSIVSLIFLHSFYQLYRDGVLKAAYKDLFKSSLYAVLATISLLI